MKTVTILNNQAFQHSIPKLKELDAFMFYDQKSSENFQGIMPDNRTAGNSNAGQKKFLALQKIQSEVKLDQSS